MPAVGHANSRVAEVARHTGQKICPIDLTLEDVGDAGRAGVRVNVAGVVDVDQRPGVGVELLLDALSA
jgi:hypothetical protein